MYVGRILKKFNSFFNIYIIFYIFINLFWNFHLIFNPFFDIDIIVWW